VGEERREVLARSTAGRWWKNSVCDPATPQWGFEKGVPFVKIMNPERFNRCQPSSPAPGFQSSLFPPTQEQ